MAKRKRLTPIDPGKLQLESDEAGVTPNWDSSRRSAPIADIAGSAATQAALDEVVAELSSAQQDGRMVQKLKLEAIEVSHLIRDRMGFNAEDMETLKASLVKRGQQAPIEVVALDGKRYGLISGGRRVEALRQMGVTEVLAFIREPEGASEAYLAMVEENEIRSGLSFYERARLSSEAVRIGVYPTINKAVSNLFAAVSASKRSKILRFVVLHEKLGDLLAYPKSIPEKLGLALSAAIETDKTFLARLRDRLRKTPSSDVATERAQLERALRGERTASPSKQSSAQQGKEIVPGVFLTATSHKITLLGNAVDRDLENQLTDWLGQYHKNK